MSSLGWLRASPSSWLVFSIYVVLVKIMMRKVDVIGSTLSLGRAGGRLGNFFKIRKN